MMFDVLTYGVRSFAFLCVGASSLPGKMCVCRDTRAALTVLKNASANPVTPTMAHGSKDAEGRLSGPSAATQRG